MIEETRFIKRCGEDLVLFIAIKRTENGKDSVTVTGRRVSSDDALNMIANESAVLRCPEKLDAAQDAGESKYAGIADCSANEEIAPSTLHLYRRHVNNLEIECEELKEICDRAVNEKNRLARIIANMVIDRDNRLSASIDHHAAMLGILKARQTGYSLVDILADNNKAPADSKTAERGEK